MPARRNSITRLEHLTAEMRSELTLGPGRSPAFRSEDDRRAAWFAHRAEILINTRPGEPRPAPMWGQYVYELGGLPDARIPGADGSFEWASCREMAEIRAQSWAERFPERTLAQWREHWGLALA